VRTNAPAAERAAARQAQAPKFSHWSVDLPELRDQSHTDNPNFVWRRPVETQQVFLILRTLQYVDLVCLYKRCVVFNYKCSSERFTLVGRGGRRSRKYNKWYATSCLISAATIDIQKIPGMIKSRPSRVLITTSQKPRNI